MRQDEKACSLFAQSIFRSVINYVNEHRDEFNEWVDSESLIEGMENNSSKEVNKNEKN